MLAILIMGTITWYDQQKRQVPDVTADDVPEIVVDGDVDLLDESVENIVLEIETEPVKKEEVETLPEENETNEEKEEEEVSGVQMEEIYIVKKGDTLASISQEVYGSITYVGEICELNGLTDGNLIFIGQKLLLP